MSKKIFIFLIIIFLIFFGLFSFYFKKLQEIKASPGSGENVEGWAFSKNIGWISFNNITGGGGISYGVNISTSTGDFSGYAWARGTDVDVGGIGWIKFNPSPPYPTAPGYSTCLDIPTIGGENCDGVGDWTVSGWARAYRAIDPGGQTLGGWEGWIKLRGPGYGVRLEPTAIPNEYEFRGWAWGGDPEGDPEAVVGWISFNCKDRGICSLTDRICDFDADCPPAENCVNQQGDGDTACDVSNYRVIATFVVNNLPTVSNTSTAPVLCGLAGKMRYRFGWSYDDADSNPMLRYDIKILDSADNQIYFASTTDSWPPPPPPTPVTTYITVPDDGPQFGGNTYRWYVKVYDSPNSNSGWVYGGIFTTPAHAYPYPDFVPSPSQPSVDEVVTFIQDGTDPNNTESLCYLGGEHLCQTDLNVRYEWDFDQNVNPGVDCDSNTNPACRGNATTTYGNTGSYTITLRITDDVGSCLVLRSINITLPLPKWKEIPPS